MAGFLSKHEELLRLTPDLQCHKCKNVPGPNGNQRNRYSCTNGAHTLCEDHKAKCPCGSTVGKSPSPVIAKLLQNLPWMCQNYKTGCREIKMNGEDLEHHQEKCIFRQVFCPSINCDKTEKIVFKDVICHQKTFHKGLNFEYRPVVGKTNTFLAKFSTPEKGLENGNSWTPGPWAPAKLTSSCGAVFFSVGKIVRETVYLWIIFFGSSDEAKKFSCTLSITSKIGEEFNFSGPVTTLDKSHDDIIASGSLLMITVDAAKRSLTDQKKLQVEISIRKLKGDARKIKEEAKD